MNNFIQDLHKKRSNYNDPDQATMQENSLEKLSSGIYTEGERFVFELLQNAVDAHSADDCLDISIRMQDGYLIFMHNGDVFTNEDIEGICFVGRKGEKARNAKKIGYKGIGFKSVFGVSSKVFIHTGNQCFCFDKDHWKDHWKNNWNSSFGDIAHASEYTMPWQVIPIESDLPISVHEGNANVATYISIDPEDESKLRESIMGLMESCRFLIFLKDANIKLSFTDEGTTLRSIEKRKVNGEVVLYVDGREESRWMVYQNPEVQLNLTEEQKKRIEKHKSTPDKLKNATSFDLSFAIAIEDGKLKKVDHAVLYTYLPTSYSFGEGFPFLVNANFITDEGRQHLDVDAEWNKVLISKIPAEYLRWIATLSKKYSNYCEVLPKKSYGSGNALLAAYEDAMKEAIANIAFIPAIKDDKLLKVSEALIDRIGLSSQIAPSILVDYMNRSKGARLSADSIVANEGVVSILMSYGVTAFDKADLKGLFEDDNTFHDISIEEDTNLVRFLHSYFLENKSEQDSLLTILTDTKFLLDRDNSLATPAKLQFPSGFENEFSDDAVVLNNELYQNLGGIDSDICKWLNKIGIEEASDISIIKKVICRPGYVTKENAIEVGKFLFRVYNHKRPEFSDKISSGELSSISLLTKNGTLISATDAYLGSVYKPDVDIEPVYKKDIYLSEDYIENAEDIGLYNAFFRKLGVSQSLKLQKRNFKCEDYIYITHLYRIIEESKKLYQPSPNGSVYPFSPDYFEVYYAPLISFNTEDYTLSKLVWSNILKAPKPEVIKYDCIRGKFVKKPGAVAYKFPAKKSNGEERAFIDDMITNIQKMPATDGTMYLSSKLIYNSKTNITLAGKYLPLIDVDCVIDESWESTLNLKKKDLTISDLLDVLDNISHDEENKEENKEQICNIYERIVELGIKSVSIQEKLKTWGSDARILSKGGEFMSPKHMSHITLEGFRDQNQVYIEKCNNREGVLEFMSLLGVKIITEKNVAPQFDDPEPNTDISTRLILTLPALAVLAKDCNDRMTYQECKEILQRKIEDTQFYQCESIALTYDDSGDTISKNTFARDGNFYFTGELRPAKMEPLLHPLCSYLDIRGKERELFVILTEQNFSDIVEYLEDKEYDVREIEEELVPETTTGGSSLAVGGQIGGGIDKASQIAENKEAKDLVLAKLEGEGFNVSNVDANWSVIKGVTRDGNTYPLVVKSCKNLNRELFLNPEEWRELFKPKSMLWLHLGNRTVVPIKAHELFTYQDKLTLTFDTENLMKDDRINKIMEVMHYFNNIHMDVATLNPDQHRAEHLEEYLFNDNNAESSDLSTAGID